MIRVRKVSNNALLVCDACGGRPEARAILVRPIVGMKRVIDLCRRCRRTLIRMLATVDTPKGAPKRSRRPRAVHTPAVSPSDSPSDAE